MTSALNAGQTFFDPYSNALTTVADVLECLRRHKIVYASPREAPRRAEPPFVAQQRIEELLRIEEAVEFSVDVLEIDTPVR